MSSQGDDVAAVGSDAEKGSERGSKNDPEEGGGFMTGRHWLMIFSSCRYLAAFLSSELP